MFLSNEREVTACAKSCSIIFCYFVSLMFTTRPFSRLKLLRPLNNFLQHMVPISVGSLRVVFPCLRANVAEMLVAAEAAQVL